VQYSSNTSSAVTGGAAAAAQDAQMGQLACGSCKAGFSGLVRPMARDLMGLVGNSYFEDQTIRLDGAIRMPLH
jgi:hypothetical protein